MHDIRKILPTYLCGYCKLKTLFYNLFRTKALSKTDTSLSISVLSRRTIYQLALMHVRCF